VTSSRKIFIYNMCLISLFRKDRIDETSLEAKYKVPVG